jgi:hypothetical protein
MKIPTIEELRKSGYKARVTVLRLTSEHSDYVNLRDIRDMFEEGDGTIDNATLNSFLSPKGGKVIVEVRTPEGVELRGEAVCASTENFSKKYGRTLALVRALGLKPEPKYKVGDEVWGVSYSMNEGRTKITNAEIKSIFQHNDKSFISEDLKSVQFIYPPCYFVSDENLAVTESDAFSSKEELLTSFES